MSFITWEQFSNPIFGAGTPVGDMIRGAGSLYCDLIRNYPAWSLSDPLGITPLNRAIGERICGTTPPLPPPDQPALPGGKCVCQRYRVDYTVDPDNFPPFTASFECRGPISVVGWRPGLVPNTYRFLVIHQNDSCNGTVENNLVGNISQTSLNAGYKVTVDAITAIGGVDNCGGQVPKYSPIQPPANELQRNVNINITPGVNIAIPVIIVRPNVDININPTVNINLQPQFNFPDLGVNIGFDLGGININNNIQIGGGNNYFPVPDPRPNPPTLPPGKSVDTDLTELYRRVNDLRERLVRIEECACDTDPVLTPVNLGSGNSGSFTLPAKTKFVVLTLTTIPGNRKEQGGLNAPDVLYAGWAWFRGVLNSLGERTPVDASAKYYQVNPQANTFCFTLYAGFVGQAVAYRES